ncbi:MAG: hypothetical protein HUU35_10000, partial [Armatimonadetes bacterium]|nr:hypothetical protein [Armatimonadota bacterium]
MGLQRSDVNLPAGASQAIERFRAEVQAAFGERLRCLVLYGSAVQGGYRSRLSDLNLLAVLPMVTSGDLALAGRAASRAGELVAPVLLAEPELGELAVVAPATLWDIIEQHHLLAGDDSLLAPVPHLDDLARQLRLELRDKLHRLRAAYLAQAGRPAQLEATARRSFGSVLHLLRGALRLYGRDAAVHPVQALGEVARTLQLDLDLLRQLFTLRYENERLGRDRLNGIFGAYLELIETAAKRLATLPPFAQLEPEAPANEVPEKPAGPDEAALSLPPEADEAALSPPPEADEAALSPPPEA